MNEVASDETEAGGAGLEAAGAVTEAAARRAVLDCARRMNGLGINHGKSGNVSMRWARDRRPGFVVTASGLPYDRAEPADLAWMPLDATDERDADGPRLPSSEWRFHRDLYRQRTDAGAIVHTHSTHATALACLPRVQRDGIPPFHYMVAAAGGEDIRCARYATFGTQALSDAVVQAIDARRACLVAHHGVIALGRGQDAAALEDALALAVEIEALAHAYAVALSVGEPALLDADEMARVVQRFQTYGRPRDR